MASARDVQTNARDVQNSQSVTNPPETGIYIPGGFVQVYIFRRVSGPPKLPNLWYLKSLSTRSHAFVDKLAGSCRRLSGMSRQTNDDLSGVIRRTLGPQSTNFRV